MQASSMNTLQWGMVGGGEGSIIGDAHVVGARMDGRFTLSAGAVDIDPERGREHALRLGVAEDRAYGDWRSMLEGERARPEAERVSLVTIATPNFTHFEIASAFLEAGFHVLCEKPMTTTVEDAEALVAVASRTGRILAVNYVYSGYPMAREMRAMVARGDLGRIRVVSAEFAHSFLADPANDFPGWRFVPAQAGVSSVLLDCGVHALHLATWVTGQEVERLTADFAHCVEGRELEDDALLAFRMTGGTAGRLWTSAVAVGHSHGLKLQVFGERGGLAWDQEHPNQLWWTPLGESTRRLERGAEGLSPQATRASRMMLIGHPEGFLGGVREHLLGSRRRDRGASRGAPARAGRYLVADRRRGSAVGRVGPRGGGIGPARGSLGRRPAAIATLTSHSAVRTGGRRSVAARRVAW